MLYGQADWGEAHRITRTQLWNYSRWKAMEQDLRQFATEMPKIEIEKLTNTLDGIFKETIGVDVSAFSGARISAGNVGDASMAVINTAWSGESYSSRIWKNTSAIASRIRSDMEDAMVNGRSLVDIKKQLMQDFSVGYNDAARLVDTEAAYVLNSAAKQRYKEDGLKKIRWLIEPEDGHECEVCKSRADKVWHIDTAPPMPAHPRCRCTWAGVVEVGDENVPCDGEDESAQEAQQATEPKTLKAAEDELRLQNMSESAKIDDRREDVVTKDGNGVRAIGQIKTKAAEEYWGNIRTEVVLTDERIEHICEGHLEDYEKYGKYIGFAIQDPTYVLEDAKNENTAMFVRHIEETNINVIVRLALERENDDILSSVITMYCLGEKTLKRLLKKNRTIYKTQDL